MLLAAKAAAKQAAKASRGAVRILPAADGELPI
jgi:hypothetical protein